MSNISHRKEGRQGWPRTGRLAEHGDLLQHTIPKRETCSENPCSVHFGLGLGSGHRLRGRAAHANARAHVDSCTNDRASAYVYSRTNRYASTHAHAGSHRYPGPDADASINLIPSHAGSGRGHRMVQDYGAGSG